MACLSIEQIVPHYYYCNYHQKQLPILNETLILPYFLLLYFQVDMPVFFYIDPEFDDDPAMETVDEITLSYTFFEAKEGLNVPLPGFMQATSQ